MEKSKLIFTCVLIFILGCGVGNKTLKINPTPLSPQALSNFYYLKYLDFTRTKKDKKALQAIKQAIRYNPSPELFIEYAKLLLSQKKLKQAKEVLKSGLQKNPGNKELMFFLADIYMFEKKFYNAYSMLKVYLKEHKQDVQAREKIASILFEEKKYKSALDYLSEIPEDKRTYNILYFMGTCYIKMGNRAKGIYFLKKSTKLNPDFFRGWAELAYQYELSNDLVSAEKIYSKLLSKGLSNKELILRLVDINIKLNKPQKAYSLAQEMISDPKDILDVVAIFLKQGFYEQGESLLKTIENFRDEYPRISYYYAIIKLKKYGDPKGALKELEHIKSDSRIYPRVLDFKIKLLIRTKDYSNAEQILSSQLQKHPNNIPLYILLSEVYVLDGKLQDAKTLLTNGVKKHPDNIDLIFQLGTVYYKLNNIDKALSLMEEILKLKPDHASALNFIGYTLVDKEINLKRGYELIEKALKIEPKNGYFLDSMAWYYYKIKKYKKAWEYINKAIKNASEDPTIWEHFGDIALKLKKFKEAKKAYKNAISKGAEDINKIKQKLKKIHISN